jgi:hypothetical protein
MKLILLLLILLLCVYCSQTIETFITPQMVVFTRLDGSLIKSFRIITNYSIYDSELEHLFRRDKVIRVNIPSFYSIRVIYKKNDEFVRTLNLPNGSYDLNKHMNNGTISQIDIVRDEYIVDYGMLYYSRPRRLYHHRSDRRYRPLRHKNSRRVRKRSRR